MNLKELRAKLAALKASGKTKLEQYNALAGKADATDEDKAKLTALDAELEAIEADIAKLDATIAEEEKKARRAGLFSSTALTPSVRFASAEPDPQATGGFRSLAEFAVGVRNAVVNHDVDDRLRAAPSSYHENRGTAGEGYEVPPMYRQAIWELVFGERDLLSLMTIEPTMSNVVQMAKDETTPWGATGVQARWRSEGSQMTPSKLATNPSTVNLHELYAFVLATEEVLADAPRLNNRLTVQAARAIRYAAGEAIMWGNGVGRPLGFMVADCKVSVAKESGQAADTIVVANVAKVYSRLLGAGSRAFWVANRDTVPQLIALTQGNNNLWIPSSAGLRDAPQGTLMGMPMLFLEHAKTVGDFGDLVLVDPDGYYAVQKAGGGIDFASSIHLYFDYAVAAFRWTFRLGGQPFLSAAVTPANGSNTRSHFVGIAARA